MGAVLRSPHDPPSCWASREPFSDRVCLLQPDPCEKVYFAISFYKVMSLQTQKPLNDSEGVRNKTTQLCCSLTKASWAPFPGPGGSPCSTPAKLSVSPRVRPSSRWFFPALQKVGFS